MAREQFANSASTTLNGGINGAVTQIVVTNAGTFPAAAQFRILVDQEIMIVTAGAGTTTWTVTRGAEGTSANTHSNGATIFHKLTAGALSTLSQKMTLNAADFGVKMDAVRNYGGSMTSGSAILTAGSVFTSDDVGKVVYVEGAGATRSFASAGSCTPTGLNFNVLTVTGGDFTAADVGAVVLLPTGAAGPATHVTHINSVISATQVVLTRPPANTVTNQTITLKGVLRSTVASYQSATQVTLNNTASSTTSTITFESGCPFIIGTDNATAFTAIGTYLCSSPPATAIDWVGGIRVSGKGRIMFDAGMCYTSGGDMFGVANPNYLEGWVIEGQGTDVTNIVYGPTSGSQYLFTDTAADEGGGVGGRWNSIQMIGISFWGIGPNSPGFYRSEGAVAQQGHYFERVAWKGSWGRVFHCDGTDVNDKWLWLNCHVTPSQMTTWYYIPDATTSTVNQLHFNIVGGVFEWNVGDWFDLGRGGDIVVNAGGSHVITQKGTYFIVRDSLTASQDGAQTRLTVTGERFERRKPAVLLIDSSWNIGVILFKGITDAGVLDQAGGTANTDVGAKFYAGRTSGSPLPLIIFEDCVLKGRHQYTWDGNNWDQRHSIVYRNCEFRNRSEASDAFTFVNDAGDTQSALTGGIPPIRLEMCRGDTRTTSRLWNTTLNWRLSRNPTLQKHIVRWSNARSKLPAIASSDTIYLPLGARLEKISLWIRNGDNVGATFPFSWTIKTSEGSPTTLADFTIPNAQTGGYLEVVVAGDSVLPWLADTDVKRQLVITAAGSNDREILGDLMLEYI